MLVGRWNNWNFYRYWCVCEVVGPLSGISGLSLCICSTSLNIPNYFPTLYQFIISPAMQEFPSLYLSTRTWYWPSSYLYPHGRSKTPTPCSCNLCFPIKGRIEHLSICLLVVRRPSCVRWISISYAHLSTALSFSYSFVGILYLLWIVIFCWSYVLHISSPSWWLTFLLPWQCLWMNTDIPYFIQIEMCYDCLLGSLNFINWAKC